MVGRFVQQQKISAAQQHFYKLELSLLSSAQNADPQRELLLGKAKSQHRGSCPGAEGKPAVPLKPFTKHRLLFDQSGKHIASAMLHSDAKRFQFALSLRQIRKNCKNLVVGRGLQVFAHMLFHVTDLRFFAKCNVSAVKGSLVDQDTEEGGFTAAVYADHADAVAVGDLKGNMIEQQLVAKCFF